MLFPSRCPLLLAICVALLLGVNSQGYAADIPVSTYAPADDLANQADQYIKGLKKSVESADVFKDEAAKLSQDANTLVVIALALGLHDQESKYKANASALMKAAQEVAAAKDFEAAKKAVADLEKATTTKSDGAMPTQWEKVASLPELMKSVPRINSKLKMNIKGSKFQKKAKDTAGYTAVLAVIAQASRVDTSETKSAEQVKQWQDFCDRMREHSSVINKAIHKGEAKVAEAEMKKLTQSCDDCHAVFHPGANAAENDDK